MSSLLRIVVGPLLVAVLVGSCAGEASPEPPPAAINPTTSTEPVGEGPLWGDVVARVRTPDGTLGPRSETRVDPRDVDGISWTGVGWEMDRDWDELTDGGYLDLGAATLELNGHKVLGFLLEVPADTGSGHVVEGEGEVGYFRITNPNRVEHNSYLRNIELAHHYRLSGVAGDAIKVGIGSSVHHDAFIEMAVVPGEENDKHYDGVQVFGDGQASLKRVVIDWNDSGTIANTTGAIFTQDDASLTARDLLVIDPGGTWQPIRLQGGGAHDVDRIQVVGTQEPNRQQPESLAPTAIVRLRPGIDRFVLFNEVVGAEDWREPAS